MKTIQYRVTYQGEDVSWTEIVEVATRDINAGFGKALKIAKAPLGNGRTREICSIEFWMVR